MKPTFTFCVHTVRSDRQATNKMARCNFSQCKIYQYGLVFYLFHLQDSPSLSNTYAPSKWISPNLDFLSHTYTHTHKVRSTNKQLNRNRKYDHAAEDQQLFPANISIVTGGGMYAVDTA